MVRSAPTIPIPRVRPARPPAPAVLGVPVEQGSTLIEAMASNAARRPDQPAMRARGSGGNWEITTWSDYQRGAREIAAGLAALGVEPGQRVAVLSGNRPEWHLADLGALTAGCVTVPLYPTSSSEQVAYALAHSRSVVCFVDGHGQLGKVLENRERVPSLQQLVIADGTRRSTDSAVMGLDELRSLGADSLEREPAETGRRAGAVTAGDLATVVYTSGTTGPPKGTMITHGNIMWTLRSVTPALGIGQGERLLSFLPLSHIAERMMSEFLPIAVGGETWFARSLATVAEDLPACRPTAFLAVPRVWEKLREAVEENVGGQPFPIRRVIERYVQLGLEKVDAEQANRPLNWADAGLREVLERTVGSVIRRQIGLDRVRVVASAAAPAHPDLIRWFHAIGLPMIQIYGQTEVCGPTTANRMDDNRIGTVGKPLPGITVKLGPDSEILVKGGNVCLGYLDDPQATQELIDADGWMHSGDTGTLEPDGTLRISGRKKDLIITAAGQNIAPQDIETDLCNDPLISEAVVVGDGRRYLAALIALDPDELSRWARRHRKLEDYEALSVDPDLEARIEAVVNRVNARRSHAEGIRKFRILPHELTAAAGELTPTMKVKRAVVYERYAAVIDDLYAG
ncbi:MAG TPA: long-chain fatty acid--CoA ligase [Acidimicrobiales bacterium]|nr:long-chain fatty acid--CoA ligase [Acidimicrobiales bacterium]